jgi:streptogramin lyase
MIWYKLRRMILTTTVVGVALMTLLVMLRSNSRAQSGNPVVGYTSAQAPGSSYLFRFDLNNLTFYTFTLPLGSLPYDLAVTGTSPVHVWITAYGRDKIGHLVFTDTDNAVYIEYPVTSVSRSGPFGITVNGDSVWFTERTANRVGRLSMQSGQIDEFYGNGLPSNAGLADIRVAPNGWAWITGSWANRLIRLVVTSTYSFDAYSHPLLVGPFGLAIEVSDAIWFTLPEAHRIGRYQPSRGTYLWPLTFPATSRPVEIVAGSGFVWFTDWQLNGIGQIEIGTLTNLNYYTPTNRPFDLASRAPNVFWLTQQDEQGALARLIYTSPSSVQLDSYPLPVAGLRPTGIDVAADQSVWLVAYAPAKLYLPTILKN